MAPAILLKRPERPPATLPSVSRVCSPTVATMDYENVKALVKRDCGVDIHFEWMLKY
jgi:hypothetical protein